MFQKIGDVVVPQRHTDGYFGDDTDTAAPARDLLRVLLCRNQHPVSRDKDVHGRGRALACAGAHALYTLAHTSASTDTSARGRARHAHRATATPVWAPQDVPQVPPRAPQPYRASSRGSRGCAQSRSREAHQTFALRSRAPARRPSLPPARPPAHTVQSSLVTAGAPCPHRDRRGRCHGAARRAARVLQMRAGDAGPRHLADPRDELLHRLVAQKVIRQLDQRALQQARLLLPPDALPELHRAPLDWCVTRSDHFKDVI